MLQASAPQNTSLTWPANTVRLAPLAMPSPSLLISKTAGRQPCLLMLADVRAALGHSCTLQMHRADDPHHNTLDPQAITNHMITVGNSNGLPLQHTVDSGSGILMKSCAGAPTCSQQIGDIFAPSTWWDCMTQPTCGYNVSSECR